MSWYLRTRESDNGSKTPRPQIPTRELAENSGSFVTNFSQADPGRGGWEGDISYDADFLASLRLCDLAFPSRSCPIRTLSRRDAKPQRFSKAIPIGLHHVGILPEKTRLICH